MMTYLCSGSFGIYFDTQLKNNNIIYLNLIWMFWSNELCPIVELVIFCHVHIYVCHVCKRENLNCNIITRKVWNICRLIQHSSYLTVLWSIYKVKLTYNSRQTATQKSKDLVTWTPLKTRDHSYVLAVPVPLCDNITIGDEYHYIMECEHFSNFRNRFIVTNLRERPNILKFKHIMTAYQKQNLKKLCKFIRNINK